MFCSHCGNQIADGVNNCPFCGANVGASPVPQQPIYNDTEPVPGSGRMNTLSIVGFVMSFVAAVVGIILSAIALRQHKNDITLRGKGFAKAGLIISIISTVISFFVYVLYFFFILSYVLA